jgi:hypothetical protein
MKPAGATLIVLSLATLACSLPGLAGVTSLPAGPSSGSLLTEPGAGLENLGHYRTTLRLIFKGTIDGKPSESVQQFSHTSWRQEAADFVSLDLIAEDGSLTTVVTGHVGQARYSQPAVDQACGVSWEEAAPGAAPFDPSSMLRPFQLGAGVGQETVNGVRAHAYRLASDAVAFPGTEAQGEVWIAVSGGYLVRYHLELTGGPDFFGAGRSGTQTFDYDLTEVNNGQGVAYPPGCAPVLSELPVPGDATGLVRLPGFLTFDSPSTPSEVIRYFDQYFADESWQKLTVQAQASGETLAIYAKAGGEQLASISASRDANMTRTDVFVEGLTPEAGQASSTGVPEVSPAARVQDSLTLLLGSEDSASVLPSFSMSIDLVLPGGLPQQSEELTAEAEAGTLHFAGSYAGMPVDAWRTTTGEFLGSDGRPNAGVGIVAWLNWQVVALSAVHAAAGSASAGGTEALDGRTAEVYGISETEASPAAPGVSAAPGIELSQLKGRIWVDAATGALLKADLSFDAAANIPGMTVQAAPGTLVISVGHVGQTKVTLP